MTEEPITRDRFAITQDIVAVVARIDGQALLLRNGETVEQIGNVPDGLVVQAKELVRLARELYAYFAMN
jgi:hypothetical protein